MANHAYIIPTTEMPTYEEVGAAIREFFAADGKFPMFVIEDTFYGTEEPGWFISEPAMPGYVALTLWMGKIGLEENYDEEKDDFSVRTPCIETRHGHAFQILWWIEGELIRFLAERYNARVVDDGSGEYDWHEHHVCASYKEYLDKQEEETAQRLGMTIDGLRGRRARLGTLLGGKAHQRLEEESLADHRSTLPVSMLCLLGD